MSTSSSISSKFLVNSAGAATNNSEDVQGFELPATLTEEQFNAAITVLGYPQKAKGPFPKGLGADKKILLQLGLRTEARVNEIYFMLMNMAQQVGAHGHLATQLSDMQEQLVAKPEEVVVAAAEPVNKDVEVKVVDEEIDMEALDEMGEQAAKIVEQSEKEDAEKKVAAEEKAKHYPHLDKEAILKAQRQKAVTTSMEQVKSDIELQKGQLTDFIADIRFMKHVLEKYLSLSPEALQLIKALPWTELEKVKNAKVGALQEIAAFTSDEIEEVKMVEKSVVGCVQAMTDKAWKVLVLLTLEEKLALANPDAKSEDELRAAIGPLVKKLKTFYPGNQMQPQERDVLQNEIFGKVSALGEAGLRALEASSEGALTKVNEMSMETRTFLVDVDVKTAKQVVENQAASLEIQGFKVNKTYKRTAGSVKKNDHLAAVKAACDACNPVDSDDEIKKYFGAGRDAFKAQLVAYHTEREGLESKKNKTEGVLNKRVVEDKAPSFSEAHLLFISNAFSLSPEAAVEVVKTYPKLTEKCTSFLTDLSKEWVLLEGEEREVLRQYSWICYALDPDQKFVAVPGPAEFKPWYYSPLGHGNRYISFLGYAPAEPVDEDVGSDDEEGPSHAKNADGQLEGGAAENAH